MLFNNTSPIKIYTLSLHDALPIYSRRKSSMRSVALGPGGYVCVARMSPPLHAWPIPGISHRSEEHTSELQSHHDLVCRLLLEKKKKIPLWLILSSFTLLT